MVPTFAKQMMLVVIGINMVAATSLVDLANGCNVTVDLLADVLNTTDYSAIDITKYTDLFQQPADVLESWTADVKTEALSNFAHEVELFIAPPTKEVASARRDMMSELEKRVDESHLYLGHQERTLSIHNARIQSARSGCFQNVACGSCVTAAGLLATSGILGCVGTAMTAEAATAAPTFGSSTAPIWIAMTQCITKVASIGAGGIGACHSAL